MAGQGMPDYPRELPDEAAVAGGGIPGRQRQLQLFVDAGTVLMLWGWSAFVVVAVSDAGNNRPDAADAAYGLLGLLMWLVGVSLVALDPVAQRFPRAARFGAAAAHAVVDGFLRPWN